MASGIELFTRYLIGKNPLLMKDFQEWVFRPGMGFRDSRFWWNCKKTRSTLHEGIDFYLYRTGGGTIRNIPCGLRVPALLRGKVVHVHGDFLGSSVYMKHGAYHKKGKVLHSVFGHVTCIVPLGPGMTIDAGDMLGFLEPPVKNKGDVPIHIHMSMAWIGDTVSPGNLDWKLLNNPRLAMLIDPSADIL